MKQSQRILLILVVGSVMTFVVGLVTAFLVLLNVSEHRRQEALENVRKPGSVTAYEQLVPQGEEALELPIPDVPAKTRNWAPDPQAAMDAFARLLEQHKTRMAESPEWQNIIGWKQEVGEYSPQRLDKLSEFLEAQQDLIDEIRRVVPMGGPVYPLDFSKGYEIELPHLSAMRDFARILQRDAFIQAGKGNATVAVDDLIAVMQLGDALADEASLISQVVRIAVYDIANDGIRQAFAPGTLPPADVARLVTHMTQSDNRQAFADSLNGECLFGVREFERMKSGQYDLLYRIGFSSSSEAIAPLLGKPLRRCLFNNEEATYASIMGRLAEANEVPYHEALPTLTAIDREIEALPSRRILSRILLPAVTPACQTQARHEAMIDLAQLGLQLEQYYAENGVYPDSLDAVSEPFGGTLPIDPFTGNAYVYRPSGDTFLLYSLGPNLADDDGVHHVLLSDIVWRGVKAPK